MVDLVGVDPDGAARFGAYALASVLYLGFLVGLRDKPGRVVLALAVLLHLFDIGARCVHGTNPISSTPEAMSFISFLLAAGYLLGSLRYGLASAGAFAAPASLVLLLLARVVPAEEGTPTMGTLGYTHILLATVGVAVFFIAAVLAVVYLFQDRQLRHKQFARVVEPRHAARHARSPRGALRVDRLPDLHGGDRHGRDVDRAPRRRCTARRRCGPSTCWRS